ncbi:MAG: YegP family protein [Bacteroidota bacterium]
MFEIYQSEKSQEYYFRLKAKNGQIILASEGYKSKASAQNGVESVKKNCGNDGFFERREAKNGKPYFILKAGNGQEIGRSQMYASTTSMENGIQSVKNNAPDGEVKDLTA